MSINLPTHKALWLVAGLGMLSLAACMHREPTVSQQPAPPTTMTTAAVQQERMAIAHACAADIDRVCPGVPPGEGRIRACMKAHIPELSTPCFDTLLKAVASEKEPS
jgi:hypothetical protein